MHSCNLELCTCSWKLKKEQSSLMAICRCHSHRRRTPLIHHLNFPLLSLTHHLLITIQKRSVDTISASKRGLIPVAEYNTGIIFVMGKTIIQPSKPHFFKPIMPGSLHEISIPKAFMRNYLLGEKCRGKATLRSNKSSKLWTVGINGFCFKDGWEDFATQHDLRIGDILVFKHEGDLMFHVLVFDSSSCEKMYPPFNTSTDPKNIKKLKTTKMKKKGFPGSRRICSHCGTDSTPGWRLGSKGPNTLCNACGLRYGLGKLVPEYRPFSRSRTSEIEVSKDFSATNDTVMVGPPRADPPQFTVTLQPSYFTYSNFPIPNEFARQNGLTKICGKSTHGSVPIILKDAKGNTWNASLKYKPSSDLVYIKKGWCEFSSANKFKVGDLCTFKIVSWWSKNVLMEASICKS